MLAMLKADLADLVIGSRYVGEGSATGGFSAARGLGSRIANRLARLVLHTEVTDPVSGFFMVRRSLFDAAAPKLSDQGFKILFDLIAAQTEPIRIHELPYRFAARHAGESKLDAMAVSDYLGLLVSRLSGNLIPQRALLFFVVGASGLVINLLAAGIGLRLGLHFAIAQTLAAVIAMTSNYLINNEITYRDRRLRGLQLLLGYFRFCALCGVGLIANVAVAELVHRILRHTPELWWVATLAGAVFGAVWNYVSTSLAVW
jgi:dolichol-phosphate mannosyltransferase